MTVVRSAPAGGALPGWSSWRCVATGNARVPIAHEGADACGGRWGWS